MSKPKSKEVLNFDDEDRTWEIDRGVIIVDFHKLLRKPKTQRQIAKAREIMARIRAEKKAKQAADR